MVHDWDPRTEEEEEKLVVSRKNKLEMFEYFAARDKELLQIKDGDLAPKRLDRKPSKRSQNRAFQKYLDLFYDRPSKIRVSFYALSEIFEQLTGNLFLDSERRRF